MKTKRQKRPGRPRSKLLQGKQLIQAAKKVLEQMVTLSPKEERITVKRLAEKLCVSRQALYNNDIQKIVDDYQELQNKNFSISESLQAARKPLEMRIAELANENAELRRKLDNLLQWWVHWSLEAINKGVKV